MKQRIVSGVLGVVKTRSIVTLGAYGAAGFGIGGAIGGAMWVAFDAPYLGFAIFGALGGASFGLAKKSWRMTIIGVLACAIGFEISFFLPFFILLVIWEPVYDIQGLFVGGIAGTIGGVSLAIGMREWKKAWLVALAGAVGFGLAAQATWNLLRGLEPQVLWGAITLTIWGILGGSALGAAMGYINQGKNKTP